MSIATKTGDDGTTALMYGRRVSKTDPRVSAYGTVDELNTALGTVRAAVGDAFVTDAVLSIQKELVMLMGELAVAPEDRERYLKGGHHFVESAMVDRLTGLIDDLEKNHHISYHGWATPGATAGSAALDVARTTCRRAEREVVALGETGAEVNPEIIRFLNRLSDLCWLWARWVETRSAALAPGP
ncbi:MAG: cob(I)alamin adenosyltransferase [Chthoniobacter sp.]|jgi:cob(I)alamin adenosyltransferase|nr:cob(I)alamin adenosyltransferase [Chthoniobacter sp.]